MKIDFKQSALDFVRLNNCANHTPAELIQKAMEQGASEAIRQVTIKLTDTRKDIQTVRMLNLYKG